MPVAALIAAGELFGVGENSIRVALTRLRAACRLERDERGRYRLGAGAEPVDRLVRSWRDIEERTRPWAGSWVGLHRAGLRRARGATRARTQRALRLMGFENLLPGMAVRPDNLRGGVEGVRETLADLGLGPALVFQLDDLDQASEARARGLWDGVELAAGYARSASELAESEERLAHAEEADAMVESFLLGGRMIRQLVFDPLLPEPIVPGEARRGLVVAMKRYDRAGRRAWAGFMKRVGSPHAGAPADTRGARAAAGLAS